MARVTGAARSLPSRRARLDIRRSRYPAATFSRSRTNPGANTLSTLDSTGTVGHWTSTTIGTDGLGWIDFDDYPLARLIGTVAEGLFCHKPCTVSGGGKSEISKSLRDYMIYGPIFVADMEKDFDLVQQIFDRVPEMGAGTELIYRVAI